MRFLFFDRVIEIEREKTITGIKTFSLSEEFLRGHFDKVALVPGIIFIESMAQLLGWLINYSHDFKILAIMSVIEGVKVSSDLRPGFEARIEAEIISTSKRDSIGRARIEVQGETVASMGRIIYSHFQIEDPGELSRWFSYYSGLKEPATAARKDT